MFSKIHVFFGTLILAVMLGASACTPAMDDSAKVQAASEQKDMASNSGRTKRPLTSAPQRDRQNNPDAINLNNVLLGQGGNPQAAEQCQLDGGNWQRVCRRGNYSCVKPYSDAGRSCSSQSDCEGRCLTNKAKNGGVCQASSNPCGCFSLYDQGIPARRICID